MGIERLRPVGISGLGAAVPERVLSNADLERMVETSDEWIYTRTGIRERRIVDPGEPAPPPARTISRPRASLPRCR